MRKVPIFVPITFKEYNPKAVRNLPRDTANAGEFP